MCKSRNRLGQAGFTLSEIMWVVMIIGILAALTVPSFSSYIKKTRVDGSRSQLMADCYFARSLAISRRETITMRFATNQYTIVNAGGTVFRTTPAADGVTFAASVDPRFYAWGLADASDITVAGPSNSDNVSLSPTGVASHGY
jgi:prepilin-type N-terminal cleavage/methylation domain-containing protein